MKNIKKYLISLNWSGFFIVLLLCCGGAAMNKSVTSVLHGLILVGIIGLPAAIFVLFVGRKQK